MDKKTHSLFSQSTDKMRISAGRNNTSAEFHEFF